MCLHAYKLNGSRFTNTNNTIGAGTDSFVVSVRHGLSAGNKNTQKNNNLIKNETNEEENLFLANGAIKRKPLITSISK